MLRLKRRKRAPNPPSPNRKRRWLIVTACAYLILTVWLCTGRPPLTRLCSARRSIDIQSGDQRDELFLGNLPIWRSASPTPFSLKVRAYRLDRTPADWHLDYSRSYPSGQLEATEYAGTVDFCQLVSSIIDQVSKDPADEKTLTAKYLTLLRSGDTRQMYNELSRDSAKALRLDAAKTAG